ncbi:hypothetical protein BQ8794_550006 [Mesorhizobium prunaredense]|uniref:Transposase n=1 Tax=Mesorhizobium prunaredense TaxID=1631249 RepID=A0A1R3VIG9_9HYPH|nr:hypothetical protein [Mesorhizobium prunaredense]SIT58663.1 hypothetical protein BQ8794_550006 [Mesorhizobium prunaredense]
MLGIPVSVLARQRDETASVQRRSIFAAEVEEVTLQNRDAAALPPHEWPGSRAVSGDVVLGEKGLAGNRRDFDTDDPESVRSQPRHVW